MTRIPIVAGNWKLNKTTSETRQFLLALRNKVAGIETRAEILVFPPHVALCEAVEAARDTGIAVGAQNVYWEESGAFTGEISTGMLEAISVTHTLIGHSERRGLFGETDEMVNRKLHKTLASTLTPVVCVGETLEEREAGRTEEVVGTQVRAALDGVPVEHAGRLVLAYEPVWAIGTGRTASPETANEVHVLIRRILRGIFGDSAAGGIRLLYGGSVKPDNASTLMAESDIDGVLVGGASLDAASFAEIIRAAP